MARLVAQEFRELPGSRSGRCYPTSPRSTRLIDGIRRDDQLLKRLHCDLVMLDDQINNIGMMNKDDPNCDKYRKLVSKEKILFLALFRRAVLRASDSGSSGIIIPIAPVDKPEVQSYNTLSEILPTDRELYTLRLSKLVVVKFVSFTIESFETALLALVPVIKQLKVLNKSYSTNVPLLLVSNYYNYVYVEKISKEYSDKNLTIQTIKQPLFPLISAITSDPNIKFNDPESCSSILNQDAAPIPKEIRYFLTHRHNLGQEHIYMRPEEVPGQNWYNPGEVYSLCEQVKSHVAANEKEYVLLLNSNEFENVVDLKILNYLCERRTGRIDLCFEVTKPTESDMNNVGDFFVKIEEKSRVLSKNALQERGYDIANDGSMLTKNMWISIPFLRTEESDAMLLKLTLAKVSKLHEKDIIRLEMTVAELVESQNANCVAVEVPAKRVLSGGPLGWLWNLLNPTWFMKHKLKTLIIYFLSYIGYHALIYVLTASLHERFLKSNDSRAEEDSSRKDREIALFWTENAVWLALVYFYLLFLTSRRVKMANRTLTSHQRASRARADRAQAMLLASTRFLYAGFNKTSEVRHWFGGNAWFYLMPLHFAACLVDFVGSALILYLIDPPNVMEPLETA